MMGNVISKMALLGTTATAAAALVAGAFKLMKEEADAYRQTIEGSIGERGLQAYLHLSASVTPGKLKLLLRWLK